MASLQTMMGSGMPPASAKSIVGTISTGVTATGTVQGDAYALISDATIFTTVGSGAGAIISSTLEVGSEIRVYNGGANGLKIYPPSGCTVNDESANVAVILGAGEGCLITRLTNTIFGAAGVSDLTAAEMEFLDGATVGTVVASKAIIASADKDVATIRHLTISGNFVSGSTTIDETDIAKIDGITNGTAAANKAVVLGAAKEISALGKVTLGTATGGLMMGAGASGANHALGATAGNALEFYLNATHTSGDMRGNYTRLYFSGAGGSGEALRAFSTINNVSVATGGTVNGAHISLGTAGASAAVSGAANALRCTFGIAAASTALGGTCSVIQVDTDMDTAVTVPPNFAFLRFTNSNAKVADVLFRVPNAINGAALLFSAHTDQAMTHSFRIVSENGTVYYLMATTTATGRS